MRRAGFLLPLCAALACTIPPAVAEQHSAAPEPEPTAEAPKPKAPAAARTAHHYQGSIEVPGQGELAYFVELTPRDDAEGYTGSIDIPDQGAQGMELEEIAWSEDAIGFTLAAGVPAKWTVKPGAGGELECMFSQGPVTVPCAIEEIDAATYAKVREPARPQTPEPPFPYEARDVEYDNGDVQLAGTLTVPEGAGPHPAVVLISGSGPQDRDETIVGHKPFWVWADHLSRHGIAVLRCDDRGVGDSSGTVKDSTADDSAGDALAAIRFLAAQPGIDKKRIGLMGHSEGGIIAPLAASKSKQVAFIVLLSAPGLRGRDIITEQAADIARAAGASDADIARAQQQRETLFEMVEAGGPEDELREKIEAFLTKDLREMAGDGQIDDATIQEAARAEAARSATRWFRDFLDRDPAAALRKVKVPVLAVWGAKDLQVDAAKNAAVVENALEKARDRDVTMKTLPGLDHLLQKSATGLPGEYATIPQTVDPAVLDLVTTWIRGHTGLGTG